MICEVATIVQNYINPIEYSAVVSLPTLFVSAEDQEMLWLQRYIVGQHY